MLLVFGDEFLAQGKIIYFKINKMCVCIFTSVHRSQSCRCIQEGSKVVVEWVEQTPQSPSCY